MCMSTCTVIVVKNTHIVYMVGYYCCITQLALFFFFLLVMLLNVTHLHKQNFNFLIKAKQYEKNH